MHAHRAAGHIESVPFRQFSNQSNQGKEAHGRTREAPSFDGDLPHQLVLRRFANRLYIPFFNISMLGRHNNDNDDSRADQYPEERARVFDLRDLRVGD